MYKFIILCSTQDPASKPVPKHRAHCLDHYILYFTIHTVVEELRAKWSVEPAIPNPQPRPKRKDMTHRQGSSLDARAVSVVQGLMKDDQLWSCSYQDRPGMFTKSVTLSEVAGAGCSACTTRGALYMRAGHRGKRSDEGKSRGGPGRIVL
jgi:hypothetical protein